jgi:integrase
LTIAERVALEAMLTVESNSASYRRAREAMRRVLVPLTQASQLLALEPSVRRCVQRVVLREMLARETACGAWDAATWLIVADAGGCFRPNVLGVAHCVGALTGEEVITAGVRATYLARRLFGRAALEHEIDRVRIHLRRVGYAHTSIDHATLANVLAVLFVQAGRAELEALTVEAIEAAYCSAPTGSERRKAVYRLAHALHGMGLLPRAITHHAQPTGAIVGVDPVWASWCARWRETAVVAPRTNTGIYYGALKAGRWLAREHPDVRTPEDWTRDVALAFVAMVNQARVGDLAGPHAHVERRRGEPLSARTKAGLLDSLCTFFRDLHEWGWCSRHFDPRRTFATPRAINALIGPKPRVLADDVWAKLLWAGLQLDEADLHTARPRFGSSWQVYPLALVKAAAIAWLFAGLRSDELVRLRVGCIRWQAATGGPAAATTHIPGDGATCLLDVPTHKTGASYTKPVDPLLGETFAAWEEQRPPQPLLIDRKTGERVSVLLCLRGRALPTQYLNQTLIPLLCQKAGVPLEDARGRITSHRARATIASQLYNAKEPMTLFELQAWLGHRSPHSTQYYARIAPTTLAQAYRDAGYFARNIRTIEVLIDRDAVGNGAATRGAPWQYFDLGHGYCTYSFFEQCPHRMACARCDFYLPKDSTKAQLVEAKDNLQRMLATIPLTDDERAAVEDGTAAVERLVDRLTDVPTPAGLTPRQLTQSGNFIPLTTLSGPLTRG